jgi:hypothetical protein|tara:strand:- start:3404 stop:3586 length:183 start_codon:yes stop_codon:yes gene_type:complete
MSKPKQIDLLKDVKEIDGVQYIPLVTANAAIELLNSKLDQVVEMVQESILKLDKDFKIDD